MSAAAERLLERLELVKRTGPDRWIARCPAHDDGNPSLSIREADDGRVLLRCWAGCETAAVMGALGLSLRDLFDRPMQSAGPLPKHERFDWRGAWRCLWHEALLASIAAADAARGQPLSPEDADRAALAAERLAAAASTLNVGEGP